MNTLVELKQYLNNEFGINKPFPKMLKVNSLIYAEACQMIFIHKVDKNISIIRDYGYDINISIGPNCGIMFKGVELILDKKS